MANPFKGSFIPTVINLNTEGGGGWLKTYNTAAPDMSQVTAFAEEKTGYPIEELRVLLDGNRVYPTTRWPNANHLQDSVIEVFPAQNQQYSERIREIPENESFREEGDQTEF